MLDRINLLSDGAIGVWRAAPPSGRKTPLGGRGWQPCLPKPLGDGVKIERCRAVLTLMFGKIGLMDLLDGCTKQHWQWNRVKGPIVPARAGCGKTMEKSTLTAKL